MFMMTAIEVVSPSGKSFSRLSHGLPGRGRVELRVSAAACSVVSRLRRLPSRLRLTPFCCVDRMGEESGGRAHEVLDGSDEAAPCGGSASVDHPGPET